jgi:hypothetical protein
MGMTSFHRLTPKAHRCGPFWRKYRDYCRARRFWQGEEDEVGRLVHTPGGIERARWVFDYNADEDDDEAGIGSAAYRFLPGEYVSISRQDRKLHAFRVVAVDPVVRSMALIKSFAVELKIDGRHNQGRNGPAGRGICE